MKPAKVPKLSKQGRLLPINCITKAVVAYDKDIDDTLQSVLFSMGIRSGLLWTRGVALYMNIQKLASHTTLRLKWVSKMDPYSNTGYAQTACQRAQLNLVAGHMHVW